MSKTANLGTYVRFKEIRLEEKFWALDSVNSDILCDNNKIDVKKCDYKSCIQAVSSLCPKSIIISGG